MHTKKILTAILFASSTNLALADEPLPAPSLEWVETGRYSNVINEPAIAQENPLKVPINTRLPMQVETVEDAMGFLLSRSGYSLPDYEVMTPAMQTLMGHEVPAVHRKMQSLTLDKALCLLAGSAYDIVVDPIHRKVTFMTHDELQAKL